MSDEWIEQRLREMPVRTLSTDADERIVAAIRATRSARRPAWHRVLYPALAACLALLFVGVLLTANSGENHTINQPPNGSSPQSVVFVHLDRPLLPEPNRNVDRLDISRWSPVDSSQK